MSRLDELRLQSAQIELEEQRKDIQIQRETLWKERKDFEEAKFNSVDHELQSMIEIARQDLLNPLYESILKEYDEAKLWLERCESKLRQAVKLTDSDKVNHIMNAQQLSNTADILDRLRQRIRAI